MTHHRAENDCRGTLFVLNEGIHGNMDGIANPKLYKKAKFGTKTLVEDYVNEVISAIEYVTSENAEKVDAPKKW